jgi:G3E family GTPase
VQLPIPLTVLTGYLGSGKTTLLKALLQCPQMAGTAVIINEFGEVGIDDALIGSAQQEPVLLPSGCVCCSVRGDLVAALLKLHESVMRGSIGDIKRVVLETTGLADPGPIAQAILSDRDLFRIYRLDGIVTTADAQHGLAQLDEAVEPARQVAMADRIVVTKTDVADRAKVESLMARLRALNPAAAIHSAVKGAIEPGCLFGLNAHEIRGAADVAGWLAADRYVSHDHDCAGAGCAHPGHHRDHAHLHGISSFCLTFHRPSRPASSSSSSRFCARPTAANCCA